MKRKQTKQKNRFPIICGFLLFWLYIACVVLFALPKQYGSATVHAEERPPSRPATTTQPIIKPVEMPKIAPKLAVSTTSEYYKQVAMEEAENYDLDPKMFVYIINCESSFNPHANHDGGNGKGITGFWKETFTRWNKQFFNGELDYNNQEDQIKLMAKAFSMGQQYRDDWTSWTKYQKYGTCYNYQIRKIKKT